MKKSRMIAIAAGIPLLMGGVAYAAAPAADTTIHGCVSKLTGVLRVPASGGSCVWGETAISWNQTGPQGPVGPQGAQGVPGQNGADGVNGADGLNGRDGTDGRDGAPGPAGPAGFSDAYLAYGSADLNTSRIPVVTINLPAGSYALFGKSQLRNSDSGDEQDGTCGLNTGDLTSVRVGQAYGPAQYMAVSVQGLLSLSAPGTATLWCSGYKMQSNYATLTALKVGAIHS
jgi:hypothetical protein